jgi:hypothetical protein
MPKNAASKIRIWRTIKSSISEFAALIVARATDERVSSQPGSRCLPLRFLVIPRAFVMLLEFA